ncbi:Txe/YoeB family addiction module toxin [Lactobacillaceae bacterium Scapto_B20]
MSDQWNVNIKSTAKGDLRKVMKSNLRDRFESIVNTLSINPFEPTQSFEKLTPPGNGLYSRRINGQHRVVYSIDNEHKTVDILSCWGHYE